MHFISDKCVVGEVGSFVVQHSQSLWANPVVLVTKRDGDSACIITQLQR